MEDDQTYDVVRDYYGKVLANSKDLKTNACVCCERPPDHILNAIKEVPSEVDEKFYGCGAPLPCGVAGLRVLDLGSGSGRDCYVMSKFVGENGSVIGVDMTEEQLAVARDHTAEFTTKLGYAKPNMKFVHGHIEYLDKAGIADESIDIIVSNCVVNLSPDKKRVLSEAYRVLAPGGEFYFSDVYCDRRLPLDTQKHEVLFGECLAGALYNEDFKRLAREVGFTDPRWLQASPIDVRDAELKAVCGEARFYSITYRLFKLPGLLETLCEDYGQWAVYKGSIPGSETAYWLDDHHRFEKGKPALVCGNTAAMLGEQGMCWLRKHFDVFGDRSVHYGIYGNIPGQTCGTMSAGPAGGSGGGGCC